MSPITAAVLAFLVTAAVIVPLMFLISKKKQDKKSQYVMRTFRKIANERAESQAILSSLKVGIVAYGSDDRLIASNPVARDALGSVPDTLNGFLDQFGEDNGIKAAFFLEGGKAAGELERHERIYRIELNPHALRAKPDGKSFTGHIITVQDFTDIQRQEEQRKAFVANVSHELKTPLTTMKSYSETLLDWGIEEKKRSDIREDVQRIYDDSLRMEDLIADLLFLSQIDSRRHVGSASLFDLSACAERITQSLMPQAKAKTIDIALHPMSRRTFVYADKMSVERILSNLIVNALHYTKENGEIRIYVGRVVDDVYLKVQDNGIGISPEHLASIFERFYRVDKTGSRRFGGTGLGLPIARELAIMQHGHIEVMSELGKGSEFTLFLPSAYRFLRETVYQLARREPLRDDLEAAAADQIRDWVREASAMDNVVPEGTFAEKKGSGGVAVKEVNVKEGYSAVEMKEEISTADMIEDLLPSSKKSKEKDYIYGEDQSAKKDKETRVKSVGKAGRFSSTSGGPSRDLSYVLEIIYEKVKNSDGPEDDSSWGINA